MIMSPVKIEEDIQASSIYSNDHNKSLAVASTGKYVELGGMLCDLDLAAYKKWKRLLNELHVAKQSTPKHPFLNNLKRLISDVGI